MAHPITSQSLKIPFPIVSNPSLFPALPSRLCFPPRKQITLVWFETGSTVPDGKDTRHIRALFPAAGAAPLLCVSVCASREVLLGLHPAAGAVRLRSEILGKLETDWD
jgi:hypothetical protein